MERLIIMLDVDEPNLKEAYRKVYRTMNATSSEDFQWESTDEAFNSDGDTYEPDYIQQCRMEVFKEENKE